MFKFILPALASVAVLGGVACSSSHKPAAQSPETTSATVSAPQGEVMSAPDVLAVLQNIHKAEIDEGRLALKRATDPRVKAFATAVIKDHEQASTKDDQLMNTLKIRPHDNKVADQIKSTADKQTSDLASASGPNFDRAYIDDQVNSFRAVLDTLDDTLIPKVTEPQIKANLVELRSRANRHLKEASDLRLSLASQPRTK